MFVINTIKRVLIFVICSVSFIAAAQTKLEFVNPLDPVTSLSGSYLELRRNHFHGGLDFRTGGQCNMPIYAVEDGYISYVRTEPRSYGKKVEITHADGTRSTYGHLNAFVGKLADTVRKAQESQQKFDVILTFGPDVIPVKKGQQFAWSGNTGSSGGPHLHFELLTSDNILLNPLEYNAVWQIQDNRKPYIAAAKIYAVSGKGTLSGGNKSLKYNTRVVNGSRILNGNNNIMAWGEVSFSVKAFDYMTGTAFHHTPRSIKLYVDNKLYSDVVIENIKFSDSRALNSFIDYDQHLRTGEYFMRFDKDKNFPLKIFKKQYNNGILNVNEERKYEIKYVAEDDFGHKDSLRFNIIGHKMTIAPEKIEYGKIMVAGQPNMIEKDGILMLLPSEALYKDQPLNYSVAPSNKFYSSIYNIGDSRTPVHTFCDIALKIENDTLKDKNKYVVATVNSQGILSKAYVGSYQNGNIVARVRELGRFTVWKDDVPPTIGAIQTKNIRKTGMLIYRVYDNLTGVVDYKGFIDGKWVLFEYDAKTSAIYCFLPNEKVERNNTWHTLRLEVTDGCGNTRKLEQKILY